MEEPSVLDYVKSKLTFWKPSSIQIPPPAPEADEEGQVKTVLSTEDGSIDSLAGRPESTAQASDYPAEKTYSISGLFMAAGTFALTLIAQSLLEPPGRAWAAGLLIYSLAAVLIVFAYIRDILTPVDLPAVQPSETNLSFRYPGIFISLVLMILAFLFFGRGNQDVPRFHLINITLWLLSIGYIVWTFWLPAENGPFQWRKWIGEKRIAAAGWKIPVTRWGLLLLLVTGMILFFRFYRLDSVPAEMVSDHAEKLLDVNDVLQGEFRVFFPRNTGREAFQFYWTVLMSKLFHTGISFLSLKLGTVIAGLITLVYIYRLGNELGSRWVALFAVIFAGFSYWANVQARIGLRFPLYPFFLAPVLFHVIRGLRRGTRNDFIWAGLWLGAGLHGYTASRIVPLLVVVGIVLYILHNRSSERREYAFWGLIIIGLISLAVFIPLLRFTLDDPGAVVFRSLTRMGDLERPLPGPAWQIFLQNTWNALVMFFWDDGDVWVHSVVHRPALDVISAALFFMGLVLVISRYVRRRNWEDIFLIISIPILLLPSILSLAFPNENPNLNRTAGAYVPVFIILAIGLEALLSAIRRSLPERLGTVSAAALGLFLILASASNNFDLLFRQYDESFRNSSWNTSEMGAVIRRFAGTFGREGDAWVVAYPYWVDTRLVGIQAGLPTRDTAISPEQLDTTLASSSAKLFLLNPQDLPALGRLQELYPDGKYWVYPASTPGKDFIIFQVLPRENLLPLVPPSSP